MSRERPRFAHCDFPIFVVKHLKCQKNLITVFEKPIKINEKLKLDKSLLIFSFEVRVI